MWLRVNVNCFLNFFKKKMVPSALGYHDSLKLSYYWIWIKNVQITKDLPLKKNAEMAKS